MDRPHHVAICSVAFLCLISSRAHGQTAVPAGARVEVQQAVRTYVEAYNRGDLSTVAEMYSRQRGVTTASGAKITRGWQRIREEIDEQVGKVGKFSISIGAVDVTPMGSENALALSKFTVNATATGQQAQGVMTLVFQKTDGLWKIIHDHSSIDLENGGATQAAVSSPAEPAHTSRSAAPAVVSIAIADGRAVEIRPAGYLHYTFQLPAGTCVITGRIVGISGGNKDFEAMILDQDNFDNWAAGQQGKAIWQSGRVVVTSIQNVAIQGPGAYHLVLSNVWSGVSAKTVQPQAAGGCTQ